MWIWADGLCTEIKKLLRAEAADIDSAAISHLREHQVTHDFSSEEDFYDRYAGRYDFVIMSDALEHFPKTKLLNNGG